MYVGVTGLYTITALSSFLLEPASVLKRLLQILIFVVVGERESTNRFRPLKIFSALEKEFANHCWGYVFASSLLGFSRNFWSVLTEEIEWRQTGPYVRKARLWPQ